MSPDLFWGGREAHLSMLGCERRFISCTSLSMLALLLLSLFILRAMTWSDARCHTCESRRLAIDHTPLGGKILHILGMKQGQPSDNETHMDQFALIGHQPGFYFPSVRRLDNGHVTRRCSPCGAHALMSVAPHRGITQGWWINIDTGVTKHRRVATDWQYTSRKLLFKGELCWHGTQGQGWRFWLLLALCSQQYCNIARWKAPHLLNRPGYSPFA